MLTSGKADRLISSSGGTSQTFNLGTAVANRMYLLSAGYWTQYNDNYIFGLVTINSSNNVKYVSLKDTVVTASVSFTNGVLTITFGSDPYSNAVLIRLS